MTVLGNVEVLEDRLEVHASLLNGISVLVDNVLHIDRAVVTSEVLAASKDSVFVRLRSDSSEGSLVNSRESEGLVDAGYEVNVVEEYFRVVGFVGVAESLEFIVSQGEVHGGEDTLELVSSHTALAELVEVSEELFNTDTLHDNQRADSVLNVRRVTSHINLRLGETVV